MVSSVVIYRCESWIIKKADVFELWCWRRLLRVPWTARRSNQSVLKESSPDIHWKNWCWSWSCNTLATWCEEQTHWKRPICWEKLTTRGEETEDEMTGWYHQLNGHEFEQTLWDSEGQGSLVCCNSCGHKELDTTEQQQFLEDSVQFISANIWGWYVILKLNINF